MRPIKHIFAAAATLALLALNAAAQSTPSFNTTNYIVPAVSIISQPTNSIGTNGIGALTGGPISVFNQTECLLYCSFTGTTNGTGCSNNITFNLLRAYTVNPPKAADWETVSGYSYSIPAQGQAYVNWLTNIDHVGLGAANWIGISLLTNNCASTNMVTNFVAGAGKKILPIRYP